MVVSDSGEGVGTGVSLVRELAISTLFSVSASSVRGMKQNISSMLSRFSGRALSVLLMVSISFVLLVFKLSRRFCVLLDRRVGVFSSVVVL